MANRRSDWNNICKSLNTDRVKHDIQEDTIFGDSVEYSYFSKNNVVRKSYGYLKSQI